VLCREGCTCKGVIDAEWLEKGDHRGRCGGPQLSGFSIQVRSTTSGWMGTCGALAAKFRPNRRLGCMLVEAFPDSDSSERMRTGRVREAGVS